MSGIIGALGGALKIASAFKTQSSTSIVGSGNGTGFWKFYSNSNVGTQPVRAEHCGKYVSKMINKIMNEATPALQTHTQEIIDELNDVSEFESYLLGDCDSMVNTANYNKGSGTFFLYCYTFSPFIHETFGQCVNIQTLKIKIDMQLAKDWIIVQKAKSSFFSCSVSQEIQYLPEKGLQTSHIINAISIAMAPAVLGLVKLPDRFMTILDTLFQEQIANPNQGVITAPTAEQTAAAYEQFKDMRTKQEEYEKNAADGFSQMSEALAALGSKGNETKADTL